MPVFPDGVYVKKDCHPASLFLIRGPKVPLKKSWRSYQHFLICGEDRILKCIWSFIYLTSSLMAQFPSSSLPFELWGIPVTNYEECGTFIRPLKHGGGGHLFLRGFMLIFWKMSYSTFRESYCVLLHLG